MDFKVIDGRTIELSAGSGKLYLEININRDAMAMTEYRLDPKNQQRIEQHPRFRMKRAPGGYNRDDPPDDPKNFIVGRWETMPDPYNLRLLPLVYEFRADGTFTGENKDPFPREKGKYSLENGNLVLTFDLRAERYTVAFTQDRMGCVPVGSDHRIARWNNQDNPLLLRKLK
jgi:hypothetical protein